MMWRLRSACSEEDLHARARDILRDISIISLNKPCSPGEEEEVAAGGRLKKKRPSFLEPFQALPDETPQEFLSKLNLVASSTSAVDGEAARKFNQGPLLSLSLYPAPAPACVRMYTHVCVRLSTFRHQHKAFLTPLPPLAVSPVSFRRDLCAPSCIPVQR